MKKALITGITGQDGSYLAEFLLEKDYEVHGIIRRSSSFNTARINYIYKDPHLPETKLYLHYGDLADSGQINNLIYNIKPDEVYHLGAQSHVRVSFDIPEYTGDITGLGTIRILDSIKKSGIETKFYQASSSEMFGDSNPPQNERTEFRPLSPYACAKVYAYWMTYNYRKGYGMHASNGILFNHESPRRGETFVTRKITRGIAQIKRGEMDAIYLGNLDSKRDWGFAGDYVKAMWLMLQQYNADDYVIATGESHSVREFLEKAFECGGFKIESNKKKGLEEEYINLENEKSVVKIDARYFRPNEIDYLLGDASKAREKLGWKPKVGFEELIEMMVEADLNEFRR